MEGFDYKALDFWWNVFQTVTLVFVAFYTWLVNRSKANRMAIDRIAEDVNQCSRRISIIEQRIDHLPGQETIATIHNRVDQVGQGVKHIEGQMQQMNTTLNLIQQTMMTKGGDK